MFLSRCCRQSVAQYESWATAVCRQTMADSFSQHCQSYTILSYIFLNPPTNLFGSWGAQDQVKSDTRHCRALVNVWIRCGYKYTWMTDIGQRKALLGPYCHSVISCYIRDSTCCGVSLWIHKVLRIKSVANVNAAINVMMVMGWWKYGKHTQCNIGGPYTDRENMTQKLILSQKQWESLQK